MFRRLRNSLKKLKERVRYPLLEKILVQNGQSKYTASEFLINM